MYMYGHKFEDENFVLKHSGPGVLRATRPFLMAGGPEGSGSESPSYLDNHYLGTGKLQDNQSAMIGVKTSDWRAGGAPFLCRLAAADRASRPQARV